MRVLQKNLSLRVAINLKIYSLINRECSIWNHQRPSYNTDQCYTSSAEREKKGWQRSLLRWTKTLTRLCRLFEKSLFLLITQSTLNHCLRCDSGRWGQGRTWIEPTKHTWNLSPGSSLSPHGILYHLPVITNPSSSSIQTVRQVAPTIWSIVPCVTAKLAWKCNQNLLITFIKQTHTGITSSVEFMAEPFVLFFINYWLNIWAFSVIKTLHLSSRSFFILDRLVETPRNTNYPECHLWNVTPVQIF